MYVIKMSELTATEQRVMRAAYKRSAIKTVHDVRKRLCMGIGHTVFITAFVMAATFAMGLVLLPMMLVLPVVPVIAVVTAMCNNRRWSSLLPSSANDDPLVLL